MDAHEARSDSCNSARVAGNIATVPAKHMEGLAGGGYAGRIVPMATDTHPQASLLTKNLQPKYGASVLLPAAG